MILVKTDAIALYIDPNAESFRGMELVARSFADDVFAVTGRRPKIVTDGEPKGSFMTAGVIGQSAIIDAMTDSGALDVTDIAGKRECYKIQVVKAPFDGVDDVLTVVGSDKRGAFFGLYHISRLIGVSPWVYWADVPPKKREVLDIPDGELEFTSKEPSVKYRGIFMNDEWPSLGSWVTETFGGFNELFYEKVFQLLLRLRGNFMWPAMWTGVFSEDGKAYPQAAAELADVYGIVMGTSHHEPMFRAGEEWKKINSRYGTNPIWDFASNGEAISAFWEDGLIRNKAYESLITVGMRGEADSALFGSEADNIALLKKIITKQKELLAKHGMSDAPQVLTIYKEVEKYWYGSEQTEGLRYWDALDDVTIMMTDDNFANVRTLPTLAERDRKAGWGMYYHFDYHGGPRSYEWVNMTPLTKVWEQMSMAYDYGVREVWVVNTGDLKPMELPISYFIDLAYDFESLGSGGINKIAEYTAAWAKEQFGAAGEEAYALAADILENYTRLSGIRKPEVTFPDTYSTDNFGEAEAILERADAIQRDAEKCRAMMPAELDDAFYQLVYYPAVASANVIKMQIYAGMNEKYRKCGSVLANRYARLGEECIQADGEMQSYYNNTMSHGKWKGMMSSPHVGYRFWTPDSGEYPHYAAVEPERGARMIVTVRGVPGAFTNGDARLPEFTDIGKERYVVCVSNGGTEAFECTVRCGSGRLKTDLSRAEINEYAEFELWADFDGADGDGEGYITVEGAGQTVRLSAKLRRTASDTLENGTFVQTRGMIAIEAEHFSERGRAGGVGWEVIENYGRTLSAVKMYPDDVSFTDGDDAPYLEYRLYLDEGGEYTLTTYTAPTNNLTDGGHLRYAAAFDGEKPVTADILPAGYMTGSYANNLWQDTVLDNIHITETRHTLTAGKHTLRIYGRDAALVLQKLALSAAPLPKSYLGPTESPRVK